MLVGTVHYLNHIIATYCTSQRFTMPQGCINTSRKFLERARVTGECGRYLLSTKIQDLNISFATRHKVVISYLDHLQHSQIVNTGLIGKSIAQCLPQPDLKFPDDLTKTELSPYLKDKEAGRIPPGLDSDEILHRFRK